MKSTKDLFFTAIFLIVLIASLPLVSAYSLTYDANGNLITGDGKFRVYDGFNHLVQVRNGNNATATILENYTWHPIEERILARSVYEINGSWKEDVLYISKEYVVVDNASGSFDYRYYYQNGQLVAQQNPDGSKLFMHGDHLGSVSLITNESGAVVEETFYSPFGEIISGGATSRYDYEAKEFDSVTGDYDFNARKVLISPPVFAQPDMNIPNVYDAQQLNRYTFERNNPYKYIDPTGKDFVLVADTPILFGKSDYVYHTFSIIGNEQEGYIINDASLGIHSGEDNVPEKFEAIGGALNYYNSPENKERIEGKTGQKVSSEFRLVSVMYANSAEDKKMMEAYSGAKSQIGKVDTSTGIKFQCIQSTAYIGKQGGVAIPNDAFGGKSGGTLKVTSTRIFSIAFNIKKVTTLISSVKQTIKAAKKVK